MTSSLRMKIMKTKNKSLAARMMAACIAIALMLSAVPAFAQDNIKVYYDGVLMEFEDTAPMLVNSRTMLPLRKVFETLGATVVWDETMAQIIAVKDDVFMVLQIDNPTAFVNNQAIGLDVPPMLIGSRTLVPARFVAEQFGCTVGWDEATQTVTITPGGPQA